MSMSLSTILNEINTANANGTILTIAQLRTYVSEASAEFRGAAANATTVLYSGNIGGTPAYLSVNDLVTSKLAGEVLTLREVDPVTGKGVDVASLINDGAFKIALEKSVKASLPVGATPTQIDTEISRIVNGTDLSGSRIATDSLWDDASKRFAAASSGDIRVIAPDGKFDSIFAQTELPALLSNPNVTSIDGISKEQLLAYQTAHGPEGLKQLIFDHSHFKVHLSGLAAGNLSTYLDFPSPDQYGEILKDPAKFNVANGAVDVLKLDGRFGSFKTSMSQAFQVGENLVKSGAVTSAANKLGALGLFAGMMFAANAASAAEANGDTEGAKTIMRDWALDAAGSAAGEVAGAAIGGIALGIAAAVGLTVAAPIAGAVILGAALIGGIFGGDAAQGIYDLAKDADDNGKLDLFDRLTSLLFGDTYTLTTPLPGTLDGGKITLDATFSREEMVAAAKADIAWRYALRELNAFVIPNIDYARHNADGSLDLYNPATGQGEMTDLYLADRAAMLTWKIRYDKGFRDDNDAAHVGAKPYYETWDTGAVNDAEWRIAA